MAFRPRNWLDRMARQRATKNWAAMRQSVGAMRPAQLRFMRTEAVDMLRELDEFLTFRRGAC